MFTSYIIQLMSKFPQMHVNKLPVLSVLNLRNVIEVTLIMSCQKSLDNNRQNLGERGGVPNWHLMQLIGSLSQ